MIETLQRREPLAPARLDHALAGVWKKHQHRECHIAPDLLLVYRHDATDLVLVRLGSHSELFKR